MCILGETLKAVNSHDNNFLDSFLNDSVLSGMLLKDDPVWQVHS